MRSPLSRPDTTGYPGIERLAGAGQVSVTYLGASSCLISDGTTALLVDGFFTRPGRRRSLLGKIAPDRHVVTRSLERAGVSDLAAVLVAHSHYDHAMDAPLVAELTGAQLLGSESTANLGRGRGLPEPRLTVVGDGGQLRFGAFLVTFVESVHAPGDPAPGIIDRPLIPPARVCAWRSAAAYSIVVAHPAGTLLVQASAHSVAGKLAGHRVEVVNLGVGTLGRRSADFRYRYWRDVVLATGARRVVAVHWDDLWTGVDRPLRPLPRILDDLATTMEFLLRQGRADGVEILLSRSWQAIDPFRDLPPRPPATSSR